MSLQKCSKCGCQIPFSSCLYIALDRVFCSPSCRSLCTLTIKDALVTPPEPGKKASSPIFGFAAILWNFTKRSLALQERPSLHKSSRTCSHSKRFISQEVRCPGEHGTIPVVSPRVAQLQHEFLYCNQYFS